MGSLSFLACFDSMPGLFLFLDAPGTPAMHPPSWMHADRDVLLQGDHRHMVPVREETILSPWEPGRTEDCSNILTGVIGYIKRKLVLAPLLVPF